MERGDEEPGIPLLHHAVREETVFSPADLLSSVRTSRGMEERSVPDVCVLDFDGDLTDKLARRGEARRYDNWPCFHSRMWAWPSEDPLCGIVPRTIGGPYAVLVAEQLAVCGAGVVVGLASAGRLDRELSLPSVYRTKLFGMKAPPITTCRRGERWPGSLSWRRLWNMCCLRRTCLSGGDWSGRPTRRIGKAGRRWKNTPRPARWPSRCRLLHFLPLASITIFRWAWSRM